MKPSISPPLVLFVILAFLWLPACSGAGNRSTAASTSRSDFVAETRVEVDELEIKPAMNHHTLEIRAMNLDAGRLTFRLFTPDGDVWWEERFTAPAHFQKTLALDMALGTWQLEIDLESATGHYDIEWRAAN